MKQLGIANGWKEYPAIVVECREKKHQLKTANLGRCYNSYSCDECGYSYEVDSSD